MSWIKHLDKKSSTTGTSDPALDNLAKHKPERADFLRRQRKFNNLLSKLRSFVHDYPVEK